MAYKMTLVHAELRTLRKANKALSKRRRAKQTHLQARGTLTVKEAQVLLAAKATGGQELGEGLLEGDPSEAGPAMQRHCGRCGKTGHNIQTCPEVKEISDKGSCIECN